MAGQQEDTEEVCRKTPLDQLHIIWVAQAWDNTLDKVQGSRSMDSSALTLPLSNLAFSASVSTQFSQPYNTEWK